MQIAILIIVMMGLAGCMSYPKIAPYKIPENLEQVCAKLDIHRFEQSRFTGNFSEKKMHTSFIPDPFVSNIKHIFKKHGVLSDCEDSNGVYEITFKIAYQETGFGRGLWMFSSGATLGIIPYKEQDAGIVEVRRDGKILIEQRIDYDLWGSIFLIFNSLNKSYKYVPDYGSSDVIEILLVQAATDAIKKDLKK